jgi:hypothetical protein
MTKNITLRMDEELLRKAKHIAVEHDLSVSAWIADLVRRASESEADAERKKEQVAYEQARAAILKVMESPGHYGGKTFSREEMHERRHISGQ